MLSPPLVSVVVPAYNAEAFIADALHSVLAQNYGAIEILLVDDGSTDGTSEVVRALAPDIRIIRQENGGVASARNTGLKAAKGDFICFLDADDGWFPGKVSAQADYLLKHPDVGLVYHAWRVWEPDDDGGYPALDVPKVTDEHAIVQNESGAIYSRLLLDCIVHTSTVMVRREVIEQVGFFDTQLTVGEDYDYWLRISRICRIDKLAGVYSYYRASVEGSLTRHAKPLNYEYLVVRRAVSKWGNACSNGNQVEGKDLEQRLAKLAFDFGYSHYHNGSSALARDAFRQALKHAPLNWRAAAYLLKSLLKPAR